MSARRRVLVVNDDPTQIEVCGRILEEGGYDVARFGSASEMLAALTEGAAADLFVVDLNMPGIDGWKLCRLLRSPDFERFNDTPILVVSATFTGADVEAITTDLGANGFLTVPYGRDSLLRYASDLLDGVHPRRRARVLVAEDDDAVARTVGRAFLRNGFEVTRAASLRETRALLDEACFDVVVLDHLLPDGTCEELLERSRCPADPGVTLVMTGNDDPSLPVALLDRGADGYVRKPFDPAFLVELARKSQRERSLLRVQAVLEKRTRELHASEGRYRSLFDAIPDLVFLLGHDGRVIELNGQATDVLGEGDRGPVGRCMAGLVPDADVPAFQEALERVLAVGQAAFETRLRGRAGDALHVEFTGVSTQHDGLPGFLLVGRDLTTRKAFEDERRRLEEQLRHAQRLESLGVLAGGIAHDFNNLLVGILGNAGLALSDPSDADGTLQCLHQIEVAARRAAELTQQILVFSGRASVETRALDLTVLIEEMGQLLEPAISKKAALELRLDPALPPVHGDAGQLRQVVMNLLMNASDALDGRPGGIRVETGRTEVEASRIRRSYLGEEARTGGYVYVQVEDDGAGMDDETRARMFEPFFTTKFAGRGLGLAATLGIIRAHGGVVEVDSKVGAGTRVRVLLPATTERPSDESQASPPSAEPVERGARVLVVDDEPAVRRLATAVLARAGYAVDGAANGREALESLRSRARPDAILLDITMPDLDGLETLATVREIDPDLPVLLSSGYPPDGLTDLHVAPGLTEFLRKPYAPGDLLAHLASLLGRADAGRGAAATVDRAEDARALAAATSDRA